MHEGQPAQLSERFQALFPPGVIAVEMSSAGEIATLLPEEAACLGRSVPKRAQEFAAGRACARRALAEFGVVDFPLTVGQQREPLWPELYVGSITHTSGLCAAVVAERKRFLGIGVDIEIAGGVTPELWPSICVAEERSWLASLPDTRRATAATLLFAAKEAFYKAQFPLVRERLHFHEIRIEVPIWDAPQGSFLARPLRTVRIAQFAALPLRGQFRLDGAFMSAGVAIGAPRA